MVILSKPGKTPFQKELARVWRPIFLLNYMGKILETLIARRLTKVAEKLNLLPKGQFGNRKNRFTKTAAKLLTAAVQTAWAQGGTASLLQLDLKGAFDKVHHGVLLNTLTMLGAPTGLQKWLQNYLHNRHANLFFNKESALFPISAEVP